MPQIIWTMLYEDLNNSLQDDELNSSIYSADEQIIQQRGRRSPQKSSSLSDYEQAREHYVNLTLNRNLFPVTKHLQQPDSPKSNPNSSISSSKSSQSPNSPHSRKPVKRKSLLRTPIKKRLKRHVNVLSQLRQSNKRRFRWLPSSVRVSYMPI